MKKIVILLILCMLLPSCRSDEEWTEPAIGSPISSIVKSWSQECVSMTVNGKEFSSIFSPVVALTGKVLPDQKEGNLNLVCELIGHIPIGKQFRHWSTLSYTL